MGEVCKACEIRPRQKGNPTCGLSECQEAEYYAFRAIVIRKETKKHRQAVCVAAAKKQKAIEAAQSREVVR